MSDQPSDVEDAGPETASPLRLRLGVLLILLWWAPFWLLAPAIADALSGLPAPPSVAVVTTTIIVIQTLLGLLGFWVAGKQVKTIVQGTTKKKALKAIWSIFLHGEIRGGEDGPG